MRILALGVLMLAMGGCATAAEQEMKTPCRKAMIDGAVATLPPLHRTLLRYAEHEDTIFAASSRAG